MAGLGHHMLAVVESLEPPELREWFEAQRESYGLEIVAFGDEDMSKRVLKALRDNRIVCLLSDRDLTGDGVEVEFFGERTTLPAGPATLSLRTGAALMPTAVYFGPGREHHAVIGPPIPVDARRSLARRHRAAHAGDGLSIRGADPAGTRTVAFAPTELAERPRMRGSERHET